MSCPISITKCGEVPSCPFYNKSDQSCSYPDKCDIVDASVLLDEVASVNLSTIRD